MTSFSSIERAFLLFIAILFLSCEKEQMGDCFKGKGDRVLRQRSISGIRRIELHDHIDLKIVIDPNEKVEVRAGKNLLPLIETEKEGELLRIKDRNTCHWVRSYEKHPKVIVRTPSVERLVNRSTGDISLKGTIQGDRFHYSQWNGMGNAELDLDVDTVQLKLHTGAGDLVCSGDCDKVDLYIGGPGFLHLEELTCKKAWAHNKGVGDIHLRVSEELRAKVQSVGSVLFEGKGELMKGIDEGEGRIDRVE